MSDERPLTRRELRERERARRGAQAQSAPAPAESPAPAPLPTPAPAPTHATPPAPRTEPAVEPPSTTVGPVDWRVGTADMGPVREQLDARLSSATAAPSATPLQGASRRNRRRDVPVRAAAVPPAAASTEAANEAAASAPAAQPAVLGTADAAAHVPHATVPEGPGPVDPVADRVPAPSDDQHSVDTSDAEPGASQPDPLTVNDDIEAGGGDSDDYFERLALASAGDAPTGMIVMPELMNPEITGALSRSGDVMLTGSMRVSRDLSSFGAYREGLDQDDDDDAEVVAETGRGEHAPVRARDAISSRTRTGVRVTPSPERRINTWIWIVVGAIGVAVVGGAGVLLYGLMSGWF